MFVPVPVSAPAPVPAPALASAPVPAPALVSAPAPAPTRTCASAFDSQGGGAHLLGGDVCFSFSRYCCGWFLAVYTTPQRNTHVPRCLHCRPLGLSAAATHDKKLVERAVDSLVADYLRSCNYK